MSPAVAVIVENTLQSLYTGLVLGCVYGLMCVGLALIFSVMRVINFAQGEFLMLGMYAALFVFTQLGISALLGPYVGPIVAAVLGGAIVFGVGIVVYEGLLRWITGLQVAGTEGEGHYPQLTLTLGLSLLLSNGGLIVSANPLATRHRTLIITLAARLRVPAVYPFSFFVSDGGSRSASGLQSRRSRVGSWRPTIHSSRTSASSSSSSCMPAWCWAAWGA